MDLGITDRVAIVTAASRGIGFAIARELAREGARVFICSRSAENIIEAAYRIRAEVGVEVTGIRANVTSEQEIERFVAEVLNQAGRVDICVTNAGGPPASTFDEADLEMYRRAFELNTLSAIRLARLVIPEMRRNRWGRIINITSVSAKQPIEGLILSNTTRAALTGWAKTLSAEVAADGITVNNIAPGYTLTERQTELAEARAQKLGKTKEEILAQWAEQTPMKRMGQPEEIAAAAVFLASERASYITGVTLQVDGGYVRGIF
ncbi:SDR family oxidoreductase [Pyrinomonas methylaliphatogenes]|jgi:3-oxoacyl-[acyl-carrier protein] reductase|uniref:3-oxoacyl-[acyl-carrier-protein] reductase n=1 Tax=Pyrinomonas methylaliphatogenes TaxID=454194 RepID=A0A0B6WW62_9BACT|nr:SDR family oxidoreductase [Pyrinomonas methylaliphatogenes]MBX5479370.1 SDR family oxidoreductase [Pyrinomonas methylaliphatogenes]CDM64509.1 dehydrogenase of unknown specificity, short-chain alcohol dehydrogenase like [Pyrinomonas methylaliphatogenes]